MKLTAFVFGILMILLFANMASAWGVTFPQPQDLQLKPGETARFWVTIDAVQSENDMDCRLQSINNGQIRIDFDLAQAVVQKGKLQALYGTITALGTAGFGLHIIEFCPDCKDVRSIQEGISVVGRYCVPFKIDVVAQRTRANPQDQIPPPPKGYAYYYIGAGIILLTILIGMAWFLFKMLKQKKKRRIIKSKKLR